MFVKFSRMLGAISCAALSLSLAQTPAHAGGKGHHYGPHGHHAGGYIDGGYLGRSAGAQGMKFSPVKVPNVNIYTGGFRSSSSNAVAVSTSSTNVTVYGGGGGGSYVSYTKVPEFVEGLEVVTVTRGAGHLARTIEGVCVSRDGHEMPAARLRRPTMHDGASHIELLRCETGLTLRAFVSHAGATADGYEVVCESGLSLWSAPGGKVHCQAKRRLACWSKGQNTQCNCECTARKPHKLACSEAELRHAFGADAIVIAGNRQSDHAAVVVTRGLSLNGGVGYAPF